MVRSLIWNFAFKLQTPWSIESLKAYEKETIKWEARVFWPEQQVVILNLLEPDLLKIEKYKYKVREDTYYLFPDDTYNVKSRRNQLLYKPMVKQSSIATGFASKINLDEPENYAKSCDVVFLNTIKVKAHTAAVVPVTKEAYIYKFHTIPKIKLEIARLEVGGGFYMSACVEGRSLCLVETVCAHLMGKQVFIDYPCFLKKIAT
ncbi:MAG: hypothetical protein H0U75_12160 [Legionella sp.]|nr:hypothetical protein [Legionella sp.]